jgi:GT2 family glycosyltransferase
MRHKRTGTLVVNLFQRFPWLYDTSLSVMYGNPAVRYQAWIEAFDILDEADLAAIRSAQSSLTDPPLLSLVVPIGDPDAPTLDALAESLMAQTYDRWEVWVVGGPSFSAVRRSDEAQTLLLDPRRRTLSEHPVSLAAEWNEVLRSASGEFLVFVDPHVSLRPHSLFLVALAIDQHPDVAVVYADDDVINADGTRADHYFKPDWNEPLFRAQNYLGGFVAFRRSAALATGGWREEPDGNSLWGLLLRVTADAPRHSIHHCPFVLSHWRQARAAPMIAAGRDIVTRAHEGRLSEVADEVSVEPVGESSYRLRRPLPDRPPLVSIVIPTTAKLQVLRPCLDGVLERTAYPAYEVLIVVNNSNANTSEELRYLDRLRKRPNVRVLSYGGAFNFSRLNNLSVACSRGEFTCFLNDDTLVIADEWLPAMVAEMRIATVAAVGAMLFYPNDRIQHAGVVVGAGDVAAHVYEHWRRGTSGYHERALVTQEVSCVTAACMLVRRTAFEDVGGFDEDLPVAFNDVDLCLRFRTSGWQIFWTPRAELYHRGTASLGRHDAHARIAEWQSEIGLMHKRWGDELLSDPYYNPNLALDPLQLWEPGFPPRCSFPWSVDVSAPGTRGKRSP